MASVQKYETKAGARYRVRYRTPDGRSTDKSGFRTKRDAEAWEAENLLARRSGTFVTESARRVPMGQLIERYLAAQATLAPTTVSNRASIASNWLVPDWGAWPVGKVQSSDVRAWVQAISTQPRPVLRGRSYVETTAGPATVVKAHAMLHSILKLAVDDRLIPENPARGTELPKVPLRSHPYLTRAELIELADSIDPRYRSLILTLGLTGLRFGEAAALKTRVYWPERRRLRVELSVTEDRGTLVWGPPKDHEVRTVALPGSLALLLMAQTRDLAPNDLVFTSARGEVLRLNTWRARAFARALDTADERREAAAAATGTRFEPFPRLTPHDLRHTAASLAVQAGANVKSVQTMLGHASAAMTLDTYADLFDSELDALAERMDGPLGRLDG